MLIQDRHGWDANIGGRIRIYPFRQYPLCVVAELNRQPFTGKTKNIFFQHTETFYKGLVITDYFLYLQMVHFVEDDTGQFI